MTKDKDRIEKEISLKASPSRVWKALTDAKEFGEWFRVKVEGEFAIGKTLRVQNQYPGYEHLRLDVTIEKMEPERLFSYRWHPFPADKNVDYSKEPTTLVEFILEKTAQGTLLKVVESGFSQIPAARRAEAYRANSGGWGEQLENIRRHVDG